MLDLLKQDPLDLRAIGAELSRLEALHHEMLSRRFDEQFIESRVRKRLTQLSRKFSRGKGNGINWSCIFEQLTKGYGWTPSQISSLTPAQVLLYLEKSLKRKPRSSVPAQPVLPDGPAPPNIFRWKGKEHSVPPLQWRLLQFLWDRKNPKVQDVIDSVWGHDSNKKDNDLSVALSRLNSRLATLNVSWAYSRKAGHCVKLQ